MRRLFFFFVVLLAFAPLVSSVCTVEFDKSAYVVGETITVTLSCSEATEKNDGYQLNWTYQNGTSVELDTGTTPATLSENFYQTYLIPSSWPNGVFINATLTGTDNSDLEGSDFANVSSTGGSNSLLISNSSFGGGYLGLVSSIKAVVTDETGKKISGGFCTVSALSNDETKILLDQSLSIVNGIIEVSDVMPPTRFREITDYAYEINCYCGSSGSATECIDEDGGSVTSSVGSTKGFFTTKAWLSVNTLTDKSSYEMKDEIFICANVTNVDYEDRIPLHIYNQVRCSSGEDNNDDVDRVLIVSDDSEPDERGISSGTTQNQCKRFVLPEADFLQGRTSECYASTTVWVLDNSREKILGYATTSPVFNLTSSELNIYPDWERKSSYVFNSIINLSSSSYSRYNGTGVGSIDLKLDSVFSTLDAASQYGIPGIDFENFLLSQYVKNVTVHNSTDSNIIYTLEYLEDGSLELEIPDQDLSSSGWLNVTLELNSFEERQTEALEGIENKTGTFHLDVECPTYGYLGTDLNCSITAQVEDTSIVQKEVDFTCFVSDGVSEYSSLNFNQMVTQSSITLYKTFLVPSSFSAGGSYVLQCYADYYNLGSRRDSFYDTFFIPGLSGDLGQAGAFSGDSSLSEGGESFLTGDSILDVFGRGDEGGSTDGGIGSEKNNNLFLILGIILFGLLVSFVVSRKNSSRFSFKVFFFSLFVLGVIAFIFYSGLFFDNSFGKAISLEDNLVRGFLITIFVCLIVVFLVKALNVQGEIKFGGARKSNYYSEQSRLQEKINKEILKRELEHYRKTGNKKG